MSFVGIHNHTDKGSNHEFRDSINKIKDLIDYSYSIGHSAVCITDHECLSAHYEAIDYYESKDWGDFKIGLGNEIYLCPEFITAENVGHNFYPHFILIATDAFGYKGIRELSTKAWTKNAFYSVFNRVPTYYSDLEEMLQTYKGHIIGSSACLGSSINRQLLRYRNTPSQQIWDNITNWVEIMIDLFGEDYFFLELQPNTHEDQIYCNNQLIKLANEYGINYLISTDAHYLKKEDRPIHKAFLLANKDSDREVDSFYQTTYIMSEDEIHEYMDEYLGYDAVQKGIDNTMLVYDKLTYYSLKKELEIPFLPLDRSEPDKKLVDKYSQYIPLLKDFAESEYEADRHMVREMLKGIERDAYYQTKQGYELTNECLSSLKISSDKMGVRWSAYLDQMADYIDIIWDTGSIVAPGRGSVIGFCIANQMGITQVNPLREETKTFPWRFLNPERASILDIDTDVNPIYRDKIINRFKEIYGYDKVTKVLTYSTEKSRSAILTAGRGLGLDNNLASYIASLVVFDRGNPRSLHTMYYGNEDNKPVPEFVKEMNEHPDLWETALKIEGLCCGIGSHAGGVIICDKPLTETCALMKTKSGDVITQNDLHECEAMSLIKIDLLATDAESKIQECLELLLNQGLIEWQGSLRSTYEKYIGIYTLERTSEDMWKLLWDHKVISAFQMEKESGKQALALIKPYSVDDLATINSVIRLMPANKNDERPLEKYARFHEDIRYWYQEMTDYGLTEKEQDILKDILSVSCGICEAQEFLFLFTMHPKIGGFDLSWADSLRRAVAKKNSKDFDKLQIEYFENAKNKKLSSNLVNYVWNVLIMTQKNYGFNKAHTLAYSLVLLQELNLNYKWNPIYWQTANLIVDSGSLDEESNESTKYGKMGVAIAAIRQEDVKIANPDINNPYFGFVPNAQDERIEFSMKGINGVNTELAQAIIQNAPYSSMDDFAVRMLDTKIVQPAQMIKLIKGGCFLTLHDSDRFKTMEWFLRRYCFKPANKLTMQQLGKLLSFRIIPDDLKNCLNCAKIKQYILDDEGLYKLYIDSDKKLPKRGYHDRYFILDDVSQPVFNKFFSEDSVVDVKDGYYIISEKDFIKEYNILIQPLRDWFNSQEALDAYNDALFKSIWNERASGTEASWNMEACCYYDQEHELTNVDEKYYGIVNYFDLPEEPEPYDWYNRKVDGEWKRVPKYRITRIAGTVLRSDNNSHSIALLTCYDVVNVKFYKGSYAFYNKRISHPLGNGKNEVLEDSWLKRGNKLLISGIRRDDQFFPLIYKDTIYKHTVNLIKNVLPNGRMELQTERIQIENE